MANKKTVTIALKDAVSADWQAKPNDHAPEDAEIIGGAIFKGTRSDNGKPGYQTVINGKSAEIRPNFKSAIVAGLSAENVVPANYDFPEKWSDVYKTNKEPEPEGLDDLSKEDQKLFKSGYSAIEKAQAAEAKADITKLQAACALADAVHDVRDGMNSTQWGYFRKFAPDTGLKAFLGKNTVGEAYKASSLRRVDGFDIETHVGSRVTGNKGIVSAYQSAINAIATAIAAAMHSETARDHFDIADVGDSECVRVLLDAYAEDGGFGISPEGTVTEAENDSVTRLALLVAPLHAANIPAEIGLFEVTDGRYRVAKVDKKTVAGTLFGLEGDDELLAAVARKLSESIVKEATADVADAAAAMVKEARDSKTPFAKWPADRAARHLATILFARWPEDGNDDEREAAYADIDGILSSMGGWLDEMRDGNLTVADILNPEAEVPENEDAAEDDADADMSE